MAVAAAPGVFTTTRGAIDDPLLLARRLHRFAGHAALIAGAFALVRLVLTMVYAGGPLHLPGMLWHMLGAAVLALLWLATRRERSMRVLHALDMGAMLTGGAAFSAMAMALPDRLEVGHVLLLILSYGMILRAVFVPSSTGRTLVVAGGLTIPFVAVVAAHAQHLVVELVYMGTWWLVSTSVCAATSSVVYGLRRDVHEAMRLGQYTLEEKLGEGGMGIVYRASHAFLKRPTAVKVLRPDHSDAVDIARFEREVQLSSRLTHPNTVHVFDYGRTADGLFFYAMELIEGASLLDVVAVFGPLPPERVAHILHQVSGSLAEAHEIGLIHRDVKPSNILLCQSGGEPDVAKLVDFGMVKQLASSDRALTAHNALVGTPLYMAPEAITDPNRVDQRADVYALGAVAYFLLTGSDVFDKDSIIAVCNDHLHAQPEPPSSRLGKRLPAALEDLVMACLAKDPADRPQSARDIQRELEPFMLKHPWRRETAKRWWQRYGAELLSHRGSGERAIRPRVERSPSGEPAEGTKRPRATIAHGALAQRP